MAPVAASPATADEAIARHKNPNKPFDIVTSYNSYLDLENPLQPPLAAISALTEALSQHSFSTVSEGLALVSDLAKTLKTTVADPIPLSAGADLFLHYLVNNVARPTDEAKDFERTIEDAKLVGQRFVERGRLARAKMVGYGRRVITDGMTVIIPEGDSLTSAFTLAALVNGIDFRVVLVESAVPRAEKANDDLRRQLDAADIAYVVVPPRAMASTMQALVSAVDDYPNVMVLASAAAAFADGGIWASEAVLQSAMLARSMEVDVMILSEMVKLTREVPKRRDIWASNAEGAETPMAVVAPRLITSFVTETGVMIPNAIAEEAIKIWF